MLSLRGHCYKLHKPVALTNSRHHSFVCRVVDSWNMLPQSVVDLCSVITFRNAINAIDFDKFLYIKST